MRPHLIGIAGPSCAGKGQLATWLRRTLGAAVLDLDCYYREQGHVPLEERRAINYDVPSALDTELLFEHAGRIAAGETVSKPVYDFALHTRSDKTTLFTFGSYVVVEGLFALHWPELRRLLDTKVFVDAPNDECLRRRVARDTTERGRQKDDVERQFAAQVLPAADLYVRPSTAFADVVLDGRAHWEDNGARVVELLRRNT